MQRNVKKLSGGVFLLVALLAVGLAGCGGDEPTPIARPVTPAPPPFQPQPVEITLGTSGDTVTLMTTEGGGFTLNGEAFASGGNVTAGNGGQYTLTLAEGAWTAQFDAVEIMVPLGMSEETVTITQAEDGSYWLGEMAVRSGETIHTAANGNEYVLRITTDESGAVTWMADYRMPMIAVMLGLSGDTVTLERREDGSYWLEEMAVTSGETTAHAGNGNTYTLTLGEDGMWMAEYREMVVDVTLGMSGETVTLRKAEDGGYWLGEMQVEDGVTVATASNGNRYQLRMDADGMWMAEYMPQTGTVTVGSLGVTLETVRAEDGSWTVVSPVTGETETLADGATFVVGGNTYTLSGDGEGNWMATYREETVTVMLGTSGETVLLTKREDGSYWLGEMRVEDGATMVTVANGNTYTLTLGADGMWTAMHDAPETQVALGTSGTTVTIAQEEDGTYTLNGETFTSGGQVTAGNGNIYAVTLEDGAWMAEYRPRSMEIQGTGGLLAVAREDGRGYDVDGAMLPSSGMGDIDTDTLGSYRVRMEDGMLLGTRLDNVKIDGDAKFKTVGLSAHPAMRGDDKSTKAVNEANTALVVAGENYSFADLLVDGVSQTKGKNFVADARTKLAGIREKIVQILDVFDTDSQRDTQITRQWGTGTAKAKTNVKAVLESVFGTKFSELAAPDDDKALGEIDDLIEALSSAEELAAALGDDGVLEDVADADDAAKILAATETESTVTYWLHGNTRFGTITRKKRANAVTAAKYDADPKTGERGAFGFGVTEETAARSRYVQTAGTARYEGQTLAVSGAGEQYAGDIEISINFQSEKVDGLVTNLLTTEGERWEYLFGEVDSIVLPTADLNSQGIWKQGTRDDATIDFGRRAGTYRPQMVDSTFEGRLLGGNREPEAGSEVVGVWSVGANAASLAGTESNSYLAGGFGASRVADGPVRRPSVDDGTQVNAMLVSDEARTVIENGQLTAKPQDWGWFLEALTQQQVRDFEAGHWTSNDVLWLYFRRKTENLNAEISLASLLAGEGAEFNRNSPKTYLQNTRELIQARRDKIAGMLEIGGLQNQINFEWSYAQMHLLTGLFWDVSNDGNRETRENRLAPAPPTGLFQQLPTKVVNVDASGRPVVDARGWTMAPDDVLDRTDAILDALSSVEGLEAAFDPGQDGLFVIEDPDDDDKEKSFLVVHGGDGELFDSAGTGTTAAASYKQIWNTTASALFNQRMWQIKATAGTTDYTRFGVWRVQHARNALRGKNWFHREVESFAWSPLPVATAQRRDQLPAGGRATYEGKTVAYVGSMTSHTDGPNEGSQAAYEGTASVEVEWYGTDEDIGSVFGTVRRSAVGAHVTTVLSDLQSVSSGDYLYHDNKEVRRLIFGKVTFGTDGSLSGHWTSLDANDHDLDMIGPIGNRNISIDYRDSSVARATKKWDNNRTGYSFKFVGSSPDGPLGVVGIYGLTGQGFGTKMADTAQDLTLKGAFGADLP